MLQNFIEEGRSVRLEHEANFYVSGVAHCKDYLSLVVRTTPEPKMFKN